MVEQDTDIFTHKIVPVFMGCKVDKSCWIAAFDASLVRLLAKLSGNVKLVEISGNFRYLTAN